MNSKVAVLQNNTSMFYENQPFIDTPITLVLTALIDKFSEIEESSAEMM